MRKIKLAFWLILVGLLGLVSWQNQAFFLTTEKIKINYFVGTYQSPELQIVLYFLIFFLAGLLISYFSSLSERFMARKTQKKLKEELSHAGIKISELEAAMSSQQTPKADAGSDAAVQNEKDEKDEKTAESSAA